MRFGDLYGRVIMEIRFTKHAEEKFEILERHNFRVVRSQVLGIVNNSQVIDRSRYPLVIVQGDIDERHVLRVVYRRETGTRIIITFYPGRKSQYEKKAA